MKNIYVLSYCDDWKDYSSREIILVTTSIRKLRNQVREEIEEKGNMSVGNEDLYHKWMKGDYREWYGCSHTMFDTTLENGMLEVWED